MITLPIALDLPLTVDAEGVIRVSNTRVTLHTIIGFYRQGEAPEAIHEGFPTVPLADLHVIIAYYLSNRQVVDEYMREVDEAGLQMRRKIEAHYTPQQRARLEELRRLKAGASQAD